MSVFGSEFTEIWPKSNSVVKFSEFGRNLLKKCENLTKPDFSSIRINDFMEMSAKFPLEFGTDRCRIMHRSKERYPLIEKQIASAYPVIHERVLALYLAFLEHKCKFGNSTEKQLYPDLTLTSFVQRLLSKRCVAFLGPNDSYLLLSGERGRGGFMDVGTPDEAPPLTLRQVLSYDEIKLSAFLSVSSHSEFINDGNRYNSGIPETDPTKIEPAGVIIGLIGSRFEVPGVMDWQDMIITEYQNTEEHGYGFSAKKAHGSKDRNIAFRQLWRDFYEEKDCLYKKAKKSKSPRFHVNRFEIFDNLMMKKRYTISFDTLLLEAEGRGCVAQQKVYVHVVGIGLGVWKIVDHQNSIFLETFGQRLQSLVSQLPHVSVVHFSHFHTLQCGDIKDGGKFISATHPDGGITTFLSNRNPAQKLPTEYGNMLLVVSYAWDGNALPGNEFWLKSLTGSGDPAAACSTLITEIHNPHINTKMVCGENLHVASQKHGVLHISDYAKINL